MARHRKARQSSQSSQSSENAIQFYFWVGVCALIILAATVIVATSSALNPSHAGASPISTSSTQQISIGDDNQDGIIDEDESGWDCTTMGNLICGDGTGRPMDAN